MDSEIKKPLAGGMADVGCPLCGEQFFYNFCGVCMGCKQTDLFLSDSHLNQSKQEVSENESK